MRLALAESAQLEVPDVLVRLESSEKGLLAAEAATRLADVGPNLIHQHRITALALLGRQLRNPL